MSTARLAGLAGAALGALGVALGAFAAHALRGNLDSHGLELWRTATLYTFVHAAALLAVASAARAQDRLVLRASAIAFAVGAALFCASLYALALGAPTWLGMITPLGGVALLTGWLLLAWGHLRD